MQIIQTCERKYNIDKYQNGSAKGLRERCDCLESKCNFYLLNTVIQDRVFDLFNAFTCVTETKNQHNVFLHAPLTPNISQIFVFSPKI